MVQISVQDKTKESKVRVMRWRVMDTSPLDIINDFFLHLQTCYGTTSPVWEDAFTFFIKDPHKQNIDIQVSHRQ